MRYSGIIYNDFNAAPGVSLTVFLQGCPHRCPGCHNPETWDFEGGKTFTSEILNQIKAGLVENGIHRNLCIMGGEPLCPENVFLTNLIITEVKKFYPDQKIFVWTGYTYDQIKDPSSPQLKNILSTIDCLIDGPYIEELRDVSLFMRGSSNQNIIYLKEQNK